MLLHFATINLAIVWYNYHISLILFLACFYFLGEKIGFMVTVSRYLWIRNLKSVIPNPIRLVYSFLRLWKHGAGDVGAILATSGITFYNYQQKYIFKKFVFFAVILIYRMWIFLIIFQRNTNK